MMGLVLSGVGVGVEVEVEADVEAVGVGLAAGMEGTVEDRGGVVAGCPGIG